MKTSDVFVPIACLWVLLFFVILPITKKESLPKASTFNQALHERDGDDERALFYDKQTVKNILKAGCLPIIPKDTNKNIQSSCDPS